MESNNNNNYTTTYKPPKSCNYQDLKDYLVFARKDNDHFIYEINKIKSESECEGVWQRLENKSLLRREIINNCIDMAKAELESDGILSDSQKRTVLSKLNMLNMELEVEDIIRDQAKKVFHKICR